MAPFLNLLWWFGYLIVGLWLQLKLPGLDALLPGFLVALQEKRWQQTTWFLLVCLLIQEGTGTLSFGSSVLWYGGVILLFHIGVWFFVTNSLFFIVLLSGGIGVLYAVLQYALGSLQNMTLPLERIIEQAFAQAMLIPPLWGIAYLTRKKAIRHAESTV